mmetsp:Transcript_6662/g.16413  ORF Transcript_6662/g.16413 Transcript_6662/m.16413 type:complete len:426 (+) Transcript_6662:509-1786(+)
MNIGDGIIDPSPLMNHGGGNNNHAFEQGAAMSVTLTDFQKTSTDGNATTATNNTAIKPISWRNPIQSTNAHLTSLSKIFTWKFLSWVAIDNFTLSGGVMTLLWSIGLPLFKELGIDASRQQLYSTMIISPFALKPFIGVTSDLFPMGGYNKRYLALVSIMLGVVGCTALLILYHSGSADVAVSQGTASVQQLTDFIVICFFAMNLEGATLDILGEGKYSEFMRLHPESGSSIISFKFVWSLLGMIVTQSYVGPLSDAGYFHVLFWIALFLLLAPFYPTWRGWIPEKKRTIDEPGMVKVCGGGMLFHRGIFQQKKTPFIAIALSGLAAPLMSAVSTYADLSLGLLCSGFTLLVLLATTYAVFPRKFFRITLGLMLLVLCRIRITSGLSYFYTANEECLPDGTLCCNILYVGDSYFVSMPMHLIELI